MPEIQDVIDKVVALQKAITPPTGEKDIAEAYDEQPQAVATFPCFVNVETLLDQSQFASAHRHIAFDVEMHLLLGKADSKYERRARRKWIKPVLDAFGGDIQLDGTCNQAHIAGADFDDYELGENLYTAVNFVLRVDMPDTFAVTA